MHYLLEEIFATHKVTDEFGNKYSLDSSIDPTEGEFISSFIKSNDVERTIEIGCAFGVSSLFICDALSEKESPQHTIIDPYQSTDWHGVGVNNLKKAKFSFFELIEEPSELALPKLLEQGQTFDFALIDGLHTFDQTLLDFFYLNRLLKIQGVLVIDDTQLPAVKKVVRYISHYPSYKIVGAVQAKHSWKRQSSNLLKKMLGSAAKLLPESYAQEILDDSVLRSDQSLKLNSSMVALQKMQADERSWDWFAPF